MTLNDQVLNQAELLAGEMDERLRLLCGAAVAILTGRLRDGVAPEDIREEFVAAASLLAVLMYLATQGMWLTHLPAEKDVQSVSLSLNGETVEVTEPEQVERALKLVGFLKYRLFTQAEADDAPLLTMTLRLRDGTECALSASGDTVWWRGKAHALRQRELFVNLTEGLFFAAD